MITKTIEDVYLFILSKSNESPHRRDAVDDHLLVLEHDLLHVFDVPRRGVNRVLADHAKHDVHQTWDAVGVLMKIGF